MYDCAKALVNYIMRRETPRELVIEIFNLNALSIKKYTPQTVFKYNKYK
jgi:hypothetical protein